MRTEPTNLRTAGELFVALAGLAAVLLFAPLGSEHFGVAVGACCVAIFVYAGYGLSRRPGTAARWGLLPGLDSDGWYFGCLYVGILLNISLMPILVVKWLLVLPAPAGAWSYFLWCAVQDFVFFALIQRDLEDLTHPALAVPVAAGLFGLSHYPLTEFVALTTLVGLLWGYLFLATRALFLVTLTHWLMGVMVLG